MKTPVTQRSRPCYSAVSALFTIPLPDHSNYSPLLPHPLPHWIIHMSLRARSFTKPLRWRLILHCCSALLQNLVGYSGETQYLEQLAIAEASVDVPFLLFKLLTGSLLSLLSLSSLCSFLNPLSSPYPPSLLSLLINSLSS